MSDESTGALDFASSQEIMSILKKIHKMGTIVIIVTQDENIAKNCQRQFVMSDGVLHEKDIQ